MNNAQQVIEAWYSADEVQSPAGADGPGHLRVKRKTRAQRARAKAIASAERQWRAAMRLKKRYYHCSGKAANAAWEAADAAWLVYYRLRYA